MAAGNWPRPDSEVIDQAGWFQITTPSSGHPWHNRVLRAHLSAEDATTQVAAVVHAYAQMKKNFSWFVFPDSTPPNLAELLKAQDMHLEHTGLGMVIGTDATIDDTPEIQMEPVGRHNLEDFVQAFVLGWDNPAMAEEVRRDVLAHLRNPEQKTLYFLGRHQGTPATSGALVTFEHSGYFLRSSVVPEFRGKGAYRALVKCRLEKLKSIGIPLACIMAMSHTSAPICRKLGFEVVGEVPVYKKKF